MSSHAGGPPLASLGRSIRGRVAVVTGAASGIGRATARLFAQEGAQVAVIDRDAAGAARVAEEIAAAGGAARGFGLDLSDAGQIAPVIAEARAALGPIDILVNNAGVALAAPIGGEGFEAAWATTLAINLTAHAHCVRACLDDLKRHGQGRIVNIASTEGLGATAFISPYTASKHGVIGLTRALAVELGPGRRDGERGLPRADPHRHDGRDPRRREGRLRQAPHRPRPLRRARGDRPHGALARPPGRLLRDRRRAGRRRRPHDPQRVGIFRRLA